MRWRYVEDTPQEGDTRTVRRFAWTPVVCGDYTVWLETYESIQVYRTRPRATTLGTLTFAGWDEIETRYLETY